ncbi:hypothetical protein QQG74_09545 [Micromonospora sp. FIMYZ51]|uniref:hypothetical protein n=1 Tax=Micromonospora sp. FIMYZ51 TaxID=3051832 RepID=UPI00311DC80E
MPGQPQLREVSWLYLTGDTIPAALIRVEQHMDGSGVWVVLHNAPASAPTVRTEHDSEHDARSEARRIRDTITDWCRQHDTASTWRTHTREPY